MMAAFADAAPAWAAAGIVPLPITPDGKRPMVKQPDTFGCPAVMGLAAKPRFADANLGFWCGSHNRLTVVDIDSPADAELQYALITYGDSPIIVQTASGNHHAYYRHDGERRRIKPDKAHPIDILGEGGICVAPPSTRPSGGKYTFLRGGLSVIASGNLPKIRAGALPAPARGVQKSSFLNAAPISDSSTIKQGERNNALFRLALPLGRDVTSQDELLDLLRQANRELANPPNDDAEVVRTASKVWQYKTENRLFVPGQPQRIVLVASTITRLAAAGELAAVTLLLVLQAAHGNTTKPFAISPGGMVEAGKIGSWNKLRYRNAIRTLLNYRAIRLVKMGGKGKHDPTLYAFTASILGD
jgi:hypothetical protein